MWFNFLFVIWGMGEFPKGFTFTNDHGNYEIFHLHSFSELRKDFKHSDFRGVCVCPFLRGKFFMFK